MMTIFVGEGTQNKDFEDNSDEDGFKSNYG